ncbi:hypothetical protein BDZ97DRAFT_209852 [Flammula alnicola]|nr:hypothetical protein BDZ97DRAFT_209852 [Flammula alnicola]
MSTPTIQVDDTDLNINYSGSWFNATTHDDQGQFGYPFLGTLHGTASNASFSYAFNASSVIVVGSLLANFEPATWECFVDGVKIPSGQFTNPVNYFPLCQQTLLDGPHVLIINATATEDRIFWFDYIRYFPSATAVLDDGYTHISSNDPQVQYGPGWELLPVVMPGLGNITTQTRSTLSLLFNGTSLTWYGFRIRDPSVATAAATATYTIDEQPPITFAWVGPSNTSAFNQVFFETGQLLPGQHKLDVVYLGNPQTAPLALHYFVVQINPTSPLNVTASSIPPISSPPITKASASAQKIPNVAGIVGGTIAGAALCVIVALLIAVIRLRRRSERMRYGLATSSTGPTTIEPFVDPYASLGAHSQPPTESETSSYSSFFRTTKKHVSSTGISVFDQRTHTPDQQMASKAQMVAHHAHRTALPRQTQPLASRFPPDSLSQSSTAPMVSINNEDEIQQFHRGGRLPSDMSPPQYTAV